MSNKPPR